MAPIEDRFGINFAVIDLDITYKGQKTDQEIIEKVTSIIKTKTSDYWDKVFKKQIVVALLSNLLRKLLVMIILFQEIFSQKS